MNWTKTSAIAEIFSSVATLATLVYLAIEIQQNAAATRANTRQAGLVSDQQLLEVLVDSPGLNLLWYKLELSDEERIRLSYFCYYTSECGKTIGCSRKAGYWMTQHGEPTASLL